MSETTLKKSKTAKMRYDIVLVKSGENLELRFENFQFLDVNGIDLTNAENRKQMGPLLAQVTVPYSVAQQSGWIRLPRD